MSDLIVLAFQDEHRASEVLSTLRRMQQEYLVDLEDAVVVVKNQEGKIKLHQTVDLTAAGAAGGTFWGLLIGLLFGLPLVGALAGAAGGALSGSLTDYGIDDTFIKDCSNGLNPGSSAIFILLKKITTDKVLPELSKFEGRILKTSLPKEAEDMLVSVAKQAEDTEQ